MIYKEDLTLTKEQSKLKWAVYCELELEDADDSIIALESLLKDLKS